MPRVLMGLVFFPRGGSAHVARNLANWLPAAGWDVTVLSGSLSLPGRPGDARAFYRGLDVRPVDMTAALAAPPTRCSPTRRCTRPTRTAPDAARPHLRAARRRGLRAPGRRVGARARARAGAARPTCCTCTTSRRSTRRPRAWRPACRSSGHLHGTELLMLEAIEREPAPLGARAGVGGADARLGRALRAADRALRLARSRAPSGCSASTRPAACAWPTASTRRPSRRATSTTARTGAATSSRSRRAGRRARRPAPSATREADLAAFGDDRGETPVLLYVGRYTEVKRIGAADRGLRARPAGASRAARRWCSSAASPASGRASTRWRRSGAPARATSSSPAGTTTRSCPTSSPPPTSSSCPRCASSSARCSSRAWRAGCRAIAVDAYGPAEIVRHGETGWLVAPDDARRPGRRAGARRSTTRRSAAGAASWRRRGRPRALRLAGARASASPEVIRGPPDATSLRPEAAVDAAERCKRAQRSAAQRRCCRQDRCYLSGFRLECPRRATGARHVTHRRGRPRPVGLYDPTYEHDACGVAFVARLDGVPEPRDGAARGHRARATSSTAAPRAPTRTPATAPACCSSCPTRCCAACSRRTSRRRAPTACASASSRGRPSGARSSSGCSSSTVAAEGQRVVGWRDVPVDKDYVGITGQPLRPVRQAPRRRGASDELARRPGRLRAQALRDPPRGRDRRRARPRHPQLLEPHARLQGHAHRPAAARLLPRPAGRAHGVGAGARALALLDQHLPELGARAPVPDDRPQRRDQHAARQRQLDARARVAARLGAVRRRPRRRSCRSCAPAARTPRRSTTCSSCSCWPAARCRTR